MLSIISNVEVCNRFSARVREGFLVPLFTLKFLRSILKLEFFAGGVLLIGQKQIIKSKFFISEIRHLFE